MMSSLSRKITLEVLVGPPCSHAGYGMLNISEKIPGQV